MLITRLRKVGGSVILAVPPAILELLRLEAGAAVCLVIDEGKLVVEPQACPRYTLGELLMQCDQRAPMSSEEQEWLTGPPGGRELM